MRRFFNRFNTIALPLAACVVLGSSISFPAPAKADSGGAASSYEINIGDALQVAILDDNQPPQDYTVGSDGQIQLPFVGGVPVSGLSLKDAEKKVADTYVSRQIYVRPSIVISIKSFRPIFVMGDVKTPGYYEFHPFLTAEQALGLAGGPVTAANGGEARILQRNALEGQLSGIDSDLAAMAAKYARVQAQIAGRTQTRWEDVPDSVRSFVKRNLFDALKPGEDQIIGLERSNFETQRKTVVDAMNETNSQITLLSQMEDVQTKALAAAQADLVRTHDLVDKGLKPLTAISPVERTVSDTQSQLLAARERESAARVKLGGLTSDLSKIDSQKQSDLVTQSQTYWIGIDKLETQRSSVQDQIDLLQQWMSPTSGSRTDDLMEYQVRRRVGGELKQIKLDPFDQLDPGDQLVVVVKAPQKTVEAGQ